MRHSLLPGRSPAAALLPRRARCPGHHRPARALEASAARATRRPHDRRARCCASCRRARPRRPPCRSRRSRPTRHPRRRRPPRRPRAAPRWRAAGPTPPTAPITPAAPGRRSLRCRRRPRLYRPPPRPAWTPPPPHRSRSFSPATAAGHPALCGAPARRPGADRTARGATSGKAARAATGLGDGHHQGDSGKLRPAADLPAHRVGSQSRQRTAPSATPGTKTTLKGVRHGHLQPSSLYAAGVADDPSVAAANVAIITRGWRWRAALMADGVGSTRIYVRALGAGDGDAPADRVDLTVLGQSGAAAGGAAKP